LNQLLLQALLLLFQQGVSPDVQNVSGLSALAAARSVPGIDATAGALWVQLERLMAQVQDGTFKVVDFDNFDQFF
jgi:hypothetical protein